MMPGAYVFGGVTNKLEGNFIQKTHCSWNRVY